MAIKRYTIDLDAELTPEQIKELEEAAKMPIVFDEDCPELTDEQLAQFRRISEINQEKRHRKIVSLRLSTRALNTARQLGKGYTAILSRILEDVLSNPEKLKKYL